MRFFFFWGFWKVTLSFTEAFGRESHSLWMVWCEDMKFVRMVAVSFHKETTRVQDWPLVGTSSSPSGRQIGDDVI